MSPLLRYIVTINTNNALGNEQTSEWQLSSNTHSDHLASTLESLMRDVKEPVRVAAAVRQKAKPVKPVTNEREPDKTKEKESEKFWLKIQSLYDDKWDTPLPITVQVVVDGVVIESGLELSKGAGKILNPVTLKRH